MKLPLFRALMTAGSIGVSKSPVKTARAGEPVLERMPLNAFF